MKKFRSLDIFIIFFSATGFLLSGCRNDDLFKVPASYRDYCRSVDTTLLKKNLEHNKLALTDCLELALTNNPDYRSTFQAINSARFRYYQALGSYLPSIGAEFALKQDMNNNRNMDNPPDGISRRERNFSTGSSLSGSWLLFDGLAREFAALIARDTHSGTLLLSQNARRLLIRAVCYAYWDVVAADAKIKIARADIDFRQSSLYQSEVRYNGGMVSLSDVLSFRINLNNAKSMLAESVFQKMCAKYALTSLLGFPAGILPDDINFDTLPCQVDLPIPGREECLDMALAARPDLRYYRILTQISSWRRFAVYAAWSPQISFFSDLNFRTWASRYGSYKYDSAYYNHDGFIFGVDVRMNLFKGFSSYNALRAARSDEKASSLNLENSFLECMLSVQNAYENVINCRTQVTLFSEMRDWVREQRRLVYSEYLGCHVTITRVNEAQRDLVQAENNLAVAQAALNKSYSQLSAAINAPHNTISGEYQDQLSDIPLVTPLLNFIEKKTMAPESGAKQKNAE